MSWFHSARLCMTQLEVDKTNFCKWLHFSESLKHRRVTCHLKSNASTQKPDPERLETGRGSVMILSHPKRGPRKCKYQIKANQNFRASFPGRPFQGALPLRRNTPQEPRSAGWQLEQRLKWTKKQCWRDAASSGNSLLEMLVDALSTRERAETADKKNFKCQGLGWQPWNIAHWPGCWAPRGTGTWQVWAAKLQPLCLSVFGKSSSHQQGQRMAFTSKAQDRTSKKW